MLSTAPLLETSLQGLTLNRRGKVRDVYEVTLQPYEYIEYKYHLEQGANLLFAWKATAPLIHDFHGEREDSSAAGGAAVESFDKQNRGEATGSLTAPFTGIHGWYWENPTNAPVTVRLTTSGFYTSAVEIRSDHTRHPRALIPVGVLASLSRNSAGIER